MKNTNPTFWLKILLVLQTLLILLYTLSAYKLQGPNLFAVAWHNLQIGDWNGQFNLDFSCYLLLSSLWIMWRSRFSVSGIFIGTIAGVLGILFFAPYLLYLLLKEKGDLIRVLLGERR